MINKVINNYVIERKLGGGGMGDVYYAKHNKVDREVAIKVLHSHLFANENIHNRFKNEANALIKLNHPNIVKIFDYIEQENFACLIMEYINGYTLDDYISKFTGPLPSSKASIIIRSILNAVGYAHDNNVYHRDIKPANIMISRDGNKVWIMDFGIAKLTDSKNYKTTHANTQLGTPFYMSPEQIKGLPYSNMSDIYSLGVTLFEMVTGKCPYHQITSLFELQSKIVNEPLPNTNDYYPGVSIRIQNAITKATQKSPEFRFQSCNEFIMYLQENEMSILPTSRIKSPTVNQPTGKSKWSAYIIASSALLIIIALASIFISNETDENVGRMVPKGINTTSISTLTDSIYAPFPVVNKTFSIQDSNLSLLDIYLARKQKETNTKLSAKQLKHFKIETQMIKYLTSDSGFSNKFDKYFITKQPTIEARNKAIKINFPTDDQILNDFWAKINNLKFIKGIEYEKSSQISSVIISKPTLKNNKSDSEISITVRFTITSLDDNTDSENVSENLTYFKSGSSYIFTK